MPAPTLLTKAYGFHSFNPLFEPNLYRSTGLNACPSFSTPKVKRQLKPEYIIFSLMLVTAIAFLIAYLLTATKEYLSPVAISWSANFAFFGVLKTIPTNRKIAAVNNALSAQNSIWGKSTDRKIKRLKSGEYNMFSPTSFHDAINKLRALQVKIADKNKAHIHLAILGSRLALQNERYNFILNTATEWQALSSQHGLNRNAIRVGLNEAEALCQGIELGIYDEALIQNIIGADLSAMVTYLLPYIYTVRELHAKRLAKRKDFLSTIPFPVNSKHYQNHTETHDLLYEHVEYYCYRWYFAEHPVEFPLFHARLLQVYRQINHFTQVYDNYEAFPFIKLTANYQQETLELIKAIK